ncbi:MAG: hypothetical protein LBB62_04685 [Proteiniphilum sp.]|jgi:hypothetical protein|nr:hypothetical protein [Proteiniphilum sp.]
MFIHAEELILVASVILFPHGQGPLPVGGLDGSVGGVYGLRTCRVRAGGAGLNHVSDFNLAGNEVS